MNRTAGEWKPVSNLVSGQLFSINSKSRKLSFVRVAADDQMVVQPVMPTGLGPEMTVAAPSDIDVMVHQPEVAPINPLSKEYCLYDRVQLRNANLTGTVIDINKSKFPDVDLIILWDKVLHGSLMSEVHPHEIEQLNNKAEGKVYDLAKEAREFLKNVQDQYHQSFKDKITKEVVDATAARKQKLEAFTTRQAQLKTDKIRQVAAATVNKYAGEFKTIVNAGILSITAGEHDYETDEVPIIVNNYSDTILAKVNTMTDDQEVTVPASVEIMKFISKSIMDGYHLIRQAYIRKHKSGFGVFSESGKLLGQHQTKKDAVKQLRAIECHKRHQE